MRLALIRPLPLGVAEDMEAVLSRLLSGDAITMLEIARFSLRGVCLKEKARDTRLLNLKHTLF